MQQDSILLPPGGKTQTDVWATPQWLFDALDKEFGFTLDPCSDGKNQKCAKHYTSQENGLLRNWGTETVFMNPPYSECDAWMRKAYGAAQEGAWWIDERNDDDRRRCEVGGERPG